MWHYDDPLRGCHFLGRIPAVSGAAIDCQSHSAVVWRLRRCMERRRAVFSACAAGWIYVRALPDPVCENQGADVRALGAAGGKLRAASDPTNTVVETSRSGRSNAANPGPVAGHDWNALLPALGHQSFAASMVRAALRQR